MILCLMVEVEYFLDCCDKGSYIHEKGHFRHKIPDLKLDLQNSIAV